MTIPGLQAGLQPGYRRPRLFSAGFRPKILQMPQSGRELGRFLELPYHIVLVRDETGEKDTWTARVEELPGCEARDETADGAARAISKAMEDWLAAALEKGAAVPEPRRTPSHSGRLLLRLPQGLHADLAHKADMEEVSLNGLITGMLAGAVGWQRDGGTEAEALGSLPDASAHDGARSRFLPAAIIVNIVVVVLAALAAIVLLIVALQNGW
jgi:predicted HicB family RNase H-like nuclease